MVRIFLETRKKVSLFSSLRRIQNAGFLFYYWFPIFQIYQQQFGTQSQTIQTQPTPVISVTQSQEIVAPQMSTSVNTVIVSMFKQIIMVIF